MTEHFKTDIRDGMAIDWDVPIRLRDGVVVRADVYRPIEAEKYPAIMSYGPYGKYLHFEDGYETAWRRMVDQHPDVPAGSTNKYQNWEVVDPEKWVPRGYACVRVDSRGCGRSPGVIDAWSREEAEDCAECIEWAAKQDWCSGKVGLNGVSYYGMNQWQTAALQPPSLAAICIWEGAADYYRELGRHGGIYCTFAKNWYDMQVKSVQHGLGANGRTSRMTGDRVSGPVTLTAEELGSNRRDLDADMIAAPLATDPFWTSRMPDWSRVTVPMLSAANWGGQGLHPRGNFEGFTQSATTQKWLEVHGIEHWTEFYTDYGLDIQLRFFDHFLKGRDNGWPDEPTVRLQVRHPGEKFVERLENEWPIARTEWTRYNLHGRCVLSTDVADAARISYGGLSDGLTFLTEPMTEDTEITGPIAAKLFVSSETNDADMFLVLRVFAPDLKEVTFQGALDPHTPVAQGWLRASHRRLDAEKSLPYRPYHTHDGIEPLTPGEIYELDVEVWPTCIVVPAGYRVGLSVRGRDYVYPGGADAGLSNMKNAFTGVGPFLHDDPRDRPVSVFGGKVTVHIGPDHPSHVLLPVIPPR